MKLMRRKVTIWSLTATVVLAVAAFVWFRQPVTRARVKLAFHGYTNTVAGTNLAIISVSNVGGQGVHVFDQYSVDFRSGSVPGFRGPTPIVPGATVPGDSNGKEFIIPPGQTHTFVVSVGPPIPGDSWRVCFTFTANSWRNRGSMFLWGLRRFGWSVPQPPVTAVDGVTKFIEY